ncbi:MAG: glycoside hydrolase family 2 protein, partial [Phaeodactylibacter sp.]|nr:glycoside hydrolase family 2 protein [Phaeodactylibacter sp.]
EMGANFVRLGHYPQDPEVYKACNELGLIVWDELPWCRGGIGEEEWKKNTRNLFQEQILQNYNHPSVLFWSVGNEVYWLPDFPGGGDTTKISAFVSELHEQAHRVDPYRLTAIRKYYAGASLVDVFSPSIWSGWYAGVYTNYQQALERERKQYSRLLHMEYGGSSHLGRHTENPVTGSGLLDENDWAEVANQVNIKNIAHEGDWTENYIVDLFDWHLKVSETTDWFAGNAQWAFKDFGTPLRPENAIPYVNQKGLANRDGTPKDAYYVFKSYWSDVPFTYIESHTWTERSGPENKSRQLCVFSNCDEVELFHQGVSMGTRKRILGDFPANNLRWDIEFREGVNQLIAVGYQDRETVAQDSLLVQYTFRRHGAPAE